MTPSECRAVLSETVSDMESKGRDRTASLRRWLADGQIELDPAGAAADLGACASELAHTVSAYHRLTEHKDGPSLMETFHSEWSHVLSDVRHSILQWAASPPVPDRRGGPHQP